MKNIKKLLALALAVLFVLSMAACGGNSDSKVTAKVINIPLSSEEYAFAVNPSDAELLTSVNNFLAEIKSNGKYDEVISHYFGEGSPVEIESATEDSSKDQLVVVTEPGFEPFEYTSGNKYVGIDMEFAKMLADYLGKELVIKSIDFDTIFETLNTGGADVGMAGITIKEDRKLLVSFSDPYYNAAQNLIVKSNNDKFNDCKTKEDVDKILQSFGSDVKIGVQNGTTGDFYVEGDDDFGFAKLNVTKVGFSNGSLAVTAMLNGDVDYVIIDEAPAQCITKAINKING
ncbi:MAG: transporter substrate-binding domain-containing protein [Clostridia bacterium]|nr:transporter substrate-binding domain-containing protein [Clostridia bacterium]